MYFFAVPIGSGCTYRISSGPVKTKTQKKYSHPLKSSVGEKVTWLSCTTFLAIPGHSRKQYKIHQFDGVAKCRQKVKLKGKKEKTQPDKVQGVFFNWCPPKKLKYLEPRLGESTST